MNLNSINSAWNEMQVDLQCKYCFSQIRFLFSVRIQRVVIKSFDLTQVV